MFVCTGERNHDGIGVVLVKGEKCLCMRLSEGVDSQMFSFFAYLAGPDENTQAFLIECNMASNSRRC